MAPAVTPRGAHESSLVICPVTVREGPCQFPQKLHNATLIKKRPLGHFGPCESLTREPGGIKTELSEQEGRLTDRGKL